MVIGSLLEENDASEAIEEKEENTPKKIKLWYHVEVERGLLRNNDFTFSLIKNEYIYTKIWNNLPKTQKHEITTN